MDVERKYQKNFQPCPVCGQAKSVGAKTCAACAGKGRGALPRKKFVIQICKNCKAEFQMPEWRIKQGRGIFCSRECANKYLTTLRGNKSLRWSNGGSHIRRRGIGWKTAREWALIRAQGKCEKCGKIITPHDYGIHHIKPYRLFRNDYEANLMSNLIVLCRSCHSKTDRLGKLPKKEVMPNGER